MTHTIRYYNKHGAKKTQPGVYHPYQWRCMGNCKRCKDPYLGRRRKLDRRYHARDIIENEGD